MEGFSFIRDYELIIGRPARVNRDIIPQSLINPRYIINGTNGISSASPLPFTGDYEFYTNVPPSFFSVRDLKISANVSQSKESGNPVSISVYNLPQEYISQIRKDDLVILRAGYKTTEGQYVETFAGEATEDLPDIFVGQVVKSSTTFDDVDKITTILCGESITPKKNSKVSKSYAAGTTRLQVINDLVSMAKTQGVPTGRITLPNENTYERRNLEKSYPLGYVVKGGLFSELKRVCEDNHMRLFTAVGRLYLEPSSESYYSQAPVPGGRTPSSAVIYTVGPDLVRGSVQKMEDNTGTLSNKDGGADKTGLEISVALNGNITVDSIIRLSGFDKEYEEELNGDYQIISITHTLDNYSKNNWTTKISLEML